MRKIKFRGKREDGVWLYGDLIHMERENDFVIMVADWRTKNNEVIPETVGQFTGLTDKNGKEIYEGDVIEDKNGIGVIMWFQTAWGVASYAHGYDGLKSYTAVDSFYSNEAKDWSVIGNLHDTPELLTPKE